MIIIDILLSACAVYILYLNFKMKASGEIPQFLISPKVNLERSKDKPGFIKYMFPRLIIYSVIVLLFSAVNIIARLFTISRYITLVTALAFFGALIYYCVITVKAQNRFLF